MKLEDLDIYVQIYNDILDDVRKISYTISFDEPNLGVYSTHIAELSLRVCTLVESLLKQRYTALGGSKKKPKYDYDCIPEILKSFNHERVVCIYWRQYRLDKKLFEPFTKNEPRKIVEKGEIVIEGDDNYAWNNAYQNLRHDFEESIKFFGTLGYMMECLAMLRALLNFGYDESDIFVLVALGRETDPARAKKTMSGEREYKLVKDVLEQYGYMYNGLYVLNGNNIEDRMDWVETNLGIVAKSTLGIDLGELTDDGKVVYPSHREETE